MRVLIAEFMREAALLSVGGQVAAALDAMPRGHAEAHPCRG